ncbi:MAG: hypothetical protein AAGK00_09835 [Pseudomonadota bacterium]
MNKPNSETSREAYVSLSKTKVSTTAKHEPAPYSKHLASRNPIFLPDGMITALAGNSAADAG